MQIIQSVKQMQEEALRLRQAGKRLALVPTMGFLHEGHLRLVDEAKARADVVILSLFVNPTQFGPAEDFEKYPRDLKRDQALAQSRGVDIFFNPEAAEMYPPGNQTFVVVTELTRGLCSRSRPGHFRGVATVVANLFLITQAQVAIFGEKDYQQLQVIRCMVTDLHFPLEVVGVPTVREPDGLAMSSRNTYLPPQARQEAAQIYRALQRAQELVAKGERKAKKIQEEVKQILKQIPALQLEYVEIVDAQTLENVETIDRPSRVMLALHLHGTRLIDNAPLIP